MPARDTRPRVRETRESANVGPVEVKVEDQRDALRLLAKTLKQHSDGKRLRRELNRNLKAAIEPMRERAKSNLLSIASSGRPHGTVLREAVAKELKVQVATGRRAGVKLWMRKRNMPREFTNAPKALNNPKGWRHPVFGNTEVWVAQSAEPVEWFDAATRDEGLRRQVRDAVQQAMETVAQQIAADVG